MDEKYTSIELTFDNLESIRIPIRYVRDFSVNKTSKNAYSIYLEINKEVMKHMKECENDIFEPLDKRIHEDDITSVRAYKTDTEYDDFYVEWDDCEGDRYRNANQHVKEDEDHFIIRIGRTM